MAYLAELQHRHTGRAGVGEVPDHMPPVSVQELRAMRNRLEEQSRTLEIERSQVQQEALVHMAAEARSQVQRDAALGQLRELSDNIQGANVARFELAKVKDQLNSLNNCCTTLNEELAATRMREEAAKHESALNGASCVSLVAERNKLETNYDALVVSSEQQLKQTKEEYARDLADVHKASQQETQALERKLVRTEDSAASQKTLLTSAIDGAHHMRRVQDEKLAVKEVQLVEQERAARRKETILDCQIEVAHEHVDRVMTVSEDLQTTLDETMRQNRELQRMAKYDKEELLRADLKAQALENDLKKAHAQIQEDRAAYVKEKTQLEEKHRDALDHAQELALASACAKSEESSQELSNQAAEFRNKERITAQEHQAFVGTLEERITGLRKDKANLEEELFKTQQDAEKSVHEVELERVVLQGELEGALQATKRLTVENESLTRQLVKLREESRSTISDMEEVVAQAKAQKDELNHDLIMLRRNTQTEKEHHLKQIATYQTTAHESKVMSDNANYEQEQTEKQLKTEKSTLQLELSQTRNEKDQVELKLRRDLQAAREASEKFHSTLVQETAKVKVQKNQTNRVQHDLMSALQALEAEKQTRAAAEKRCDEIEILWKMRCEKLRKSTFAEIQDGKDRVARVEMARAHAEKMGLEDAGRARDAEIKAEALSAELVKANAELGSALEEIDDAEVTLTQIDQMTINPEISNQVEFLNSPMRVHFS
jgi:hypothetical protein